MVNLLSGETRQGFVYVSSILAVSLFPSDETDEANVFPVDSAVAVDTDSAYQVNLNRIQRTALETARIDRDPETLAFAGALDPARRVTEETTMFAVIAASVLAKHVANSAQTNRTHGPTAGGSLASPLPDTVDVDSDPLTVGAALLVRRDDVTVEEAAAIAGLPPNIIRRTVQCSSE